MPGLMLQRSFWASDRQRAFFDVRVFNPFSPSYRNAPPAQVYRRNELEKKRAYDQRVREIEHGSFSPLVFSTTGGMGTTATVLYKRLASMISEKYEKPYSKTMQWIRCRLNIFRCFVLPSCACVDLDPQDTTRITTSSVEALLTLPAHWAGSQTTTELLIIPFTLESLIFLYFIILWLKKHQKNLR